MERARQLFLGIAAACTGLIGLALYLQIGQGQEPCPLCILQRYAFIVIGLLALAGGLHGRRRLSARIYGLLISLASLTGAGIAARQVWLQMHPPKVVECGPDLAYLVGSLPWADLVPQLFKGEGDCAAVTWRFLGLSIAQCALLWFLLFLVLGLAAPALRKRR